MIPLRVALAFGLCGTVPLDATAADRRPDECASHEPAPLLRQGCAGLDAFLTTFNAKDADAWASTLNFPHLRLAADQVQVRDMPADYARSDDVRDIAEGGWAYTRWDWRQLVRSSDDSRSISGLLPWCRQREHATIVAGEDARTPEGRPAGRVGRTRSGELTRSFPLRGRREVGIPQSLVL